MLINKQLKNYIYIYNALNKTVGYKHLFFRYLYVKKLIYYIKNSFGRKKGSIVHKAKCGRKWLQISKNEIFFKLSNSIYMVYSLCKFKFKWRSFIINTPGIYISHPINYGYSYFSLYLSLFSKWTYALNIKSIFSLLFFFKNAEIISYLELKPIEGFKYIKAGGSIGKLFFKNYKKYTCIIYLPSGEKKFILLFCRAMHYFLLLNESKSETSNKAGFWRNCGYKQTVRGIAKNSIDHPHGGNNNSIKYARTPWGLTTKF